MGWGSGGALFVEVWAAIRPYIMFSRRKEVAKAVMECFEGHDCDNLCECFNEEWPEIEEAYRELHP